MNTTIQEVNDQMLGILEGRLDTAAAVEFAKDIEPLVAAADKQIVLDCEKLEFISSSGLRLLLTLRKATMAKGGNVTLKNVSADIKQVFSITGFISLFTFE